MIAWQVLVLDVEVELGVHEVEFLDSTVSQTGSCGLSSWHTLVNWKALSLITSSVSLYSTRTSLIRLVLLPAAHDEGVQAAPG